MVAHGLRSAPCARRYALLALTMLLSYGCTSPTPEGHRLGTHQLAMEGDELDCMGVPGGSAFIDACGICVLDPAEACSNCSDAECDDGNPCNGVETCDPVDNVCTPGVPVVCEAQGQCYGASCDPETGLCSQSMLEDFTLCDDGNDCTGWIGLGDRCVGGACGWHQGLTDPWPNGTPCDDGDPNTVDDECQDAFCNGNNPCNGVSCMATSPCHDPGECQLPSATCTNPAKPDGVPCDDGDLCTDNDTCSGGSCSGEAQDCDDDNLCTVDGCDTTSGCSHTDVDCDDSDACTGDLCDPLTGDCINAPNACDDSNECTDDACNPATGACVFTPNEQPCDDGDPNTANDQCVSGGCVGVNPCEGVSCTATSPCHDAGECQPASGTCTNPAKPAGTPCDDGDLCTDSDTCSDGSCSGEAKDCDDDNPCTDDGCAADTGMCYATPNTGSCDDDDPCTEPDGCTDGACVGPPNDCDDSDACTDDVCDPETGCDNPDVDCDDDNPCTVDECDTTSGCSHAEVDCDDDDPCTGDVCDPLTGDCINTPIACDDSNECTDDACNPATGACVFTHNEQPCDDGEPNTVNDQCASGGCVGTNLCEGVSCPATSPCHDAGECQPASGTCTNPAKPSGTPCDDGDLCTVNDTCSGGTCAGEAKDCDDDNPCTQNGCADDTGLCYATPVSGSCDDADPCTEPDACTDGACVGPPNDCDDSDACTDDVCDPETGCDNPDVDCDDDNPCTVDECDTTSGCSHAEVDCNDDDPCTGDVCDPQTGDCVNTPIECDDGNECTDDFCNPVTTTCVFTPSQQACDDEDPCTIGDVCEEGTCQGDPKCDDGHDCTTDGCDAGDLGADGTGTCHFTPNDNACEAPPDAPCKEPICDVGQGCTLANLPNGTPCDDGAFCTDPDTCEGGACVAGPDRDCDDGSDCTDDTCDEADDVCLNELADDICTQCDPDKSDPPDWSAGFDYDFGDSFDCLALPGKFGVSVGASGSATDKSKGCPDCSSTVAAEISVSGSVNLCSWQSEIFGGGTFDATNRTCPTCNSSTCYKECGGDSCEEKTFTGFAGKTVSKFVGWNKQWTTPGKKLSGWSVFPAIDLTVKCGVNLKLGPTFTGSYSWVEPSLAGGCEPCTQCTTIGGEVEVAGQAVGGCVAEITVSKFTGDVGCDDCGSLGLNYKGGGTLQWGECGTQPCLQFGAGIDGSATLPCWDIKLGWYETSLTCSAHFGAQCAYNSCDGGGCAPSATAGCRVHKGLCE